MQPTIGVGSIIRHKGYLCKVLRFCPKVVVVKQVFTGAVLNIPYRQVPLNGMETTNSSRFPVDF